MAAAEINNEDFTRILHEIIAEGGVALLLSLPGVYEIAAEELNNDVLRSWEEQQDG